MTRKGIRISDNISGSGPIFYDLIRAIFYFKFRTVCRRDRRFDELDKCSRTNLVSLPCHLCTHV